MKLLRLLVLFLAAAAIASAAPRPGVTAVAQTGSACGTAAHCVVLTWTASTSAASCTSPCSFGYNVYSGTAAGAEDLAKPVNSTTPVSGTTFTIPVTLTSTPQTLFFVVQAVETSSGITASSPSSAEVSASFPGTPAAPTGVTATKQ